MKSKEVLLFLLLGGASAANAQTACPQGVAPGSPACGPSGGGWVAPPPSAPTQRWKLTWGAFASDPAQSVIGTSTGQFSRRAASKAAMAKCASLGGRNCKVTLTYENQCAVVAEPVEDLQPMASIQGSGPSVEEASMPVLEACARGNNGHQCKIVYSNCTGPVLEYR